MKSSGFTLIELLVTISIIAILTAISIPVYRGNRSQLALQRAANKLAQDIRRAQEKAMAAKKFGESVPQGGYGVYFVANSWPITASSEYNSYIYADLDGSEKYTTNEETEIISLEKEVKIKMVEDISPPTNKQEFSINFKPPDPEVKIMKWNPGPAAEGEGVVITLSLRKNPNLTKKVIVNKSGLIYVK